MVDNNRKSKKYIPGMLLIGSLWLTLSTFSWFHHSLDISASERRKLAQFPDLSFESLISGKFMDSFEAYALDQFPHRDDIRTLKAISAFYLFGQKDNNGIYITGGYAAKLEYPLNENSVSNASARFNYLYEKYMKNKKMNIYLSIVPDKAYFSAKKNGYPSMDYDRLFSLMQKGMPFAKYIDITDCLELSDYYKTDTHWRQEKIVDVAQRLAESMCAGDTASDIPGKTEKYTEITTDLPFYGVYYGQSALPLKNDIIHYLTNDVLDACTVYNVENSKTGDLYDINKLTGRDPYEIFLSGASPVQYIESQKAASDKELIVFRDSFGSSLIPLLAQGYKKITLVDTRYLSSELVSNYVDFDKQDVLFLYSTTILNNSMSLK